MMKWEGGNMCKDKCEIHKKKYDKKILLSLPPQIHWICEICGEEGYEFLDEVY